MKKTISKTIIALCVCVLSWGEVNAQFSLGGLKDMLSSSTVGDVLSAVVGTDNSVTAADLAGTWTYAAPACKFESSDLLKSAGTAAVVPTLEKKLATYYTKAGITSSRVSITFVDSTFTMKYGKAKLEGYLSKDEESGKFIVTFAALKGAIPVLVIDAAITKSDNTMEMLFDVKQFVQVLSTVASRSQNNSLTSIVSLLESYDGILIGFEMKR